MLSCRCAWGDSVPVKREGHCPLSSAGSIPHLLLPTPTLGHIIQAHSSSSTIILLAGNLFFCLFVFLFWPPCDIWSSQARDEIGAAVAIYATMMATPDP